MQSRGAGSCRSEILKHDTFRRPVRFQAAPPDSSSERFGGDLFRMTLTAFAAAHERPEGQLPVL